MKKKVVLVLLSLMITTSLLTGCTNEEINALNSISALNTESAIQSLKLSASAEEAAVYAQVSDRVLLDLTALDAVTDIDKQAVVSYMESVDAQLCGTLDASDGVIDDYYTNYLLMEFEKTPYYWQRTQMNIRGMDAKSRSIVVDVTYKTIDFEKNVQDSSFIALGEPNYEQMLEVRYQRWISILSSKFSYSNSDWQTAYNKFVEVYGEPEDIIEAQKAKSLTTQIYEKGNQGTYNGLVNSEDEQSGATMTVRYILVPDYVLGINQGFDCKHMYVLNYALDKDPTANKELYNEEGSAKIADSVYELIYSLNRAIDEDNYTGLYSLIHNFESVDKYYSDLFDTTYRKHENFTISLFDISGAKIECGVTEATKIRAKGSNMTMPIYKERWYYTIELIDSKLQVTDAVLISSELEGEPVINTEEVETTGFTSKIVLDSEDKRDLESLIANFGSLQLLGDTSSDKFSEVVDTSISNSQMTELKTNMMSVSGATRVTWISSYLQGQSNYASIRCKELFQKSDNSINEATVTYEFINKGNRWYIYSYTINSYNKIDTLDLATKGSLCTVVPGEVKNLNSQVIATDVQSSSASAGNAEVGEIFTYEEYTPNVKEAVSKTDYNKYTGDNLVMSDLEFALSSIFESSEFTDYTLDEVMEYYNSSSDELQFIWRESIANYLNFTNNYVNSTEYNLWKSEVSDDFDSIVDDLRKSAETDDDKEFLSDLKTVYNRVISLLP